MSSKLKYSQNWNVTKTYMSPKLISHQNWNVTKSEMSPKLKILQNWIVSKTEVSSKLKCYLTEMLPNIIMSSKIKTKIPEIGTEYPGLVYWLNLSLTHYWLAGGSAWTGKYKIQNLQHVISSESWLHVLPCRTWWSW